MNRYKTYRNLKGEQGFSLIELVIAVGILAILAVVGVVAYGKLTNQARQTAVDTAAATVLKGALANKASETKSPKDAETEWMNSRGDDKIEVEVIEKSECLTVEARSPFWGNTSTKSAGKNCPTNPGASDNGGYTPPVSDNGGDESNSSTNHRLLIDARVIRPEFANHMGNIIIEHNGNDIHTKSVMLDEDGRTSYEYMIPVRTSGSGWIPDDYRVKFVNLENDQMFYVDVYGIDYGYDAYEEHYVLTAFIDQNAYDENGNGGAPAPEPTPTSYFAITVDINKPEFAGEYVDVQIRGDLGWDMQMVRLDASGRGTYAFNLQDEVDQEDIERMRVEVMVEHMHTNSTIRKTLYGDELTDLGNNSYSGTIVIE